MEHEDDKTKKLNDDFVEFVRKRSDVEAPRYTTRLRTYVDNKRKRERANAARRHYDKGHEKLTKKKTDDELKDKGLENKDNPVGDKDKVSRSSVKSVAGETSEGSLGSLPERGSCASTDAFCAEPFLTARLPARPNIRDGDKLIPHGRSCSRSRSVEPSDRCGGRRRRRRRRRTSCKRRRRRRRRSCGRRRRRRRSCGRRRRRSSRRRRSRRRRRRSCRRRRRRGCRRRR